MVSTLPWSTGAVYGDDILYYSSFCSQSGDCWGMIGSLIALLLTGHFILPIALVYGAAFLGEGVRLNRESIEDAIKKQVDIQLDSSYFIGEPQDRQYVRENESRVRVGSKKKNDTEAGGFWGTDWESWASEKTCTPRQKKQHSDPITW